MGCPHMSLQQLMDWTDRVEASLAEAGNKKVLIPTVFTAAPAVLKEFEKTPYAARLKATGVITSYICPLMYMNNPLAGKMPVITSSNKLRTYTTARYYTDDEILAQHGTKCVRLMIKNEIPTTRYEGIVVENVSLNGVRLTEADMSLECEGNVAGGEMRIKRKT